MSTLALRPSKALLRLELAETMRSRWLVFTAATYALMFLGFVWLGLRESRVLGFTGLSRVVLNLTNAVVLAVPLVALVATAQTIVRARQSGYFELMLSLPVQRRAWFGSVVASRLLVVLGPLVVLFVGAWGFGLLGLFGTGGAGDPELGAIIARSLSVTMALAWAFLGIGMWLSSRAVSAERATVLALVTWIATAALHDFALIGALLRFKILPQAVFAIAAINPIEAARVAILAGVEPELSVLGPVGFWLANTFGASRILAIGLLGPAIIGTIAMFAALRRLEQSDLVS